MKRIRELILAATLGFMGCKGAEKVSEVPLPTEIKMCLEGYEELRTEARVLRGQLTLEQQSNEILRRQLAECQSKN